MKTTTIYRCKSATEAQDRANIAYININSAVKMEREGKAIRLLNKRGTPIAVFQY